MVIGALVGGVGIVGQIQGFAIVWKNTITLQPWLLMTIGGVFAVAGIVMVAIPNQPRPSAADSGQLLNGYLTEAAQMTAQSQPMEAPCALNIWEPAGALRQGRIGLNGYPVGELSGGNGLTTQTQVTQNILTIFDMSTGNAVNAPFTAVPGGVVNLAVTISPAGSILLGQS
jgi:hypothetical protein